MHNEPVGCGRMREQGHFAGRKQSRDFDTDYPPRQTTEPKGNLTILPIKFPHGQRCGIGLALRLKEHSDSRAYTGRKCPTLNECSPISVSRFGCRGYGQPLQKPFSKEITGITVNSRVRVSLRSAPSISS